MHAGRPGCDDGSARGDGAGGTVGGFERVHTRGHTHRGAGHGGDRRARALREALREEHVEPGDERRAHRQVGRTRVGRGGDQHVALTGHGPGRTTDAGHGVGGADVALRGERVPAARDGAVEPFAAERRGTIAPRAEAPRDPDAFECAVRIGELERIRGREKESRCARAFRRDDRDGARRAAAGAHRATSLDERIDRAAEEEAGGRVRGDGRRFTDMRGEVADVVGAEFVGRELDRTGDPAAGERLQSRQHGRSGLRASAGECAITDDHAPGSGIGAADRGAHRAARIPVRGLGGDGRDRAIHRGRAVRLHDRERDAFTEVHRRVAPTRRLPVREEHDPPVGDPTLLHERGRTPERAGGIARAVEGAHAGECVAERGGRAAGDCAIERHDPELIRGTRAVDHRAGHGGEPHEHRPLGASGRRGERVVEHECDGDGRVSDARKTSDGTRGREGEREDDRDAQHHQQEVPEPHLARVFLLHAEQVAHGREVQLHAGAPAEEMEEERDTGSGGEQKRPGREKTHERRCLAAKARRRGRPKGWSVVIGS